MGASSCHAICRALAGSRYNAWISKHCMICREVDTHLGFLFIISPAHTLDILCHLCQHFACTSTIAMTVTPEISDAQTTRPSVTAYLIVVTIQQTVLQQVAEQSLLLAACHAGAVNASTRQNFIQPIRRELLMTC